MPVNPWRGASILSALRPIVERLHQYCGPALLPMRHLDLARTEILYGMRPAAAGWPGSTRKRKKPPAARRSFTLGDLNPCLVAANGAPAVFCRSSPWPCSSWAEFTCGAISRPGSPPPRFPPRRRRRMTCAGKWRRYRKRSAPPISTRISTSGSAVTIPPIPIWDGLRTKCWSCGKIMI